MKSGLSLIALALAVAAPTALHAQDKGGSPCWARIGDHCAESSVQLAAESLRMNQCS